MTANDPPILRQIRRDFRPLFVRIPPDAFKQMEIYAVGRRIPSVHRIMESTRGKIMHGRFVRWPPLHSADSPSPYNGPPRRFRLVLLTENRRSLSRMPLQPSVVPSRLSTPSPPPWTRDTLVVLLLIFYSDPTVAKIFEIILYLKERFIIEIRFFGKINYLSNEILIC